MCRGKGGRPEGANGLCCYDALSDKGLVGRRPTGAQPCCICAAVFVYITRMYIYMLLMRLLLQSCCCCSVCCYIATVHGPACCDHTKVSLLKVCVTHLRENLPLPRGRLPRLPASSWYVARTATALRLLGAA